MSCLFEQFILVQRLECWFWGILEKIQFCHVADRCLASDVGLNSLYAYILQTNPV